MIRKNPETTRSRHFRVMKGYSYRPIKKAGNRNRTGDLRTTNATHYRLCYASIPFPLENFYTLSWRPCSVNHEFTFFEKSLCEHFFEHIGVTHGHIYAFCSEADNGTDKRMNYSEKNFALIFSVGIFSPVQSSKAAAPWYSSMLMPLKDWRPQASAISRSFVFRGL